MKQVLLRLSFKSRLELFFLNMRYLRLEKLTRGGCYPVMIARHVYRLFFPPKIFALFG